MRDIESDSFLVQLPWRTLKFSQALALPSLLAHSIRHNLLYDSTLWKTQKSIGYRLTTGPISVRSSSLS